MKVRLQDRKDNWLFKNFFSKDRTILQRSQKNWTLQQKLFLFLSANFALFLTHQSSTNTHKAKYIIYVIRSQFVSNLWPLLTILLIFISISRSRILQKDKRNWKNETVAFFIKFSLSSSAFFRHPQKTVVANSAQNLLYIRILFFSLSLYLSCFFIILYCWGTKFLIEASAESEC